MEEVYVIMPTFIDHQSKTDVLRKKQSSKQEGRKKELDLDEVKDEMLVKLSPVLRDLHNFVMESIMEKNKSIYPARNARLTTGRVREI